MGSAPQAHLGHWLFTITNESGTLLARGTEREFLNALATLAKGVASSGVWNIEWTKEH